MPSRPTEKVCTECGTSWVTTSLRARTCSPKCRARMREREHPSPGRPQREYPVDVVLRVQQLHAAGATVQEIDVALGPGYKAQLLVERFVSERHAPGPRDQSGERNPQWKGANATYQALHLRVGAARGKPDFCACCDTTDPEASYHWANLSGHYEDIHDYARLCVSCHMRLDYHRRAELGRSTRLPGGGGEYV